MDYQKIHDAIIDRARNRLVEGYTERHHIVPKCLGGTDDPENLIRLTAREHFVVHQLLVRLHPENHKLTYAACMLCVSNGTHKRVNNRMYEWLKIRFSAALKIDRAGEKHPLYGKPRGEETKKKISDSLTGRFVGQETRKKLSIASTGRPQSAETREKHRIANTGRPVSQETREKHRINNTGKLVSEKTRKKLSIARKQYEQRRKEGLTQQASV